MVEGKDTFVGEETFSDRNIHAQRRATRALLKFCDDRGDKYPSVAELRLCLKALDRNDIKSAVQAYQRVPLGGMGCFNDWLPPVVFSHETPEYVQAVFEALTTQWSLLMKLSLPNQDQGKG
jgi:hypothetical protein